MGTETAGVFTAGPQVMFMRTDDPGVTRISVKGYRGSKKVPYSLEYLVKRLPELSEMDLHDGLPDEIAAQVVRAAIADLITRRRRGTS